MARWRRQRAAGAERVCDEGPPHGILGAKTSFTTTPLDTIIVRFDSARQKGVFLMLGSEGPGQWTDGGQEPATMEGRARGRTGRVHRALGEIVLARSLSGSHISTVAEKHALMFLDETELAVTDADGCGMALKEGNGLLGGRVLHARVRTGRPRAYATALDNEIHHTLLRGPSEQADASRSQAWATAPRDRRGGYGGRHRVARREREGGVEAVRAEGDGDEYRIGNRGSRFDQKKGRANAAWCNLIIYTNTAARAGFGGEPNPAGLEPGGEHRRINETLQPQLLPGGTRRSLITPLTRIRLGITFSIVGIYWCF
ncbi:hypothetical protein K438DRAFT_1758785 [Mycena galopus ATCC 62051]|nr:hypothetical protein K438DRAFT_1758785 [Mycena galopus ATCC 62051]